MKKIIILSFILSPLFISAQKIEKNSRAYVGLMLHDMDQPGISVVNSFGISQYIGLGAGVDVTSYKKGLMVPAYIDLRIKCPIKALVPYVIGQFGKPLYNRTEGTGVYITDINGGNRKEIMIKRTGNIFYGGGIGISYKPGKIGCYLSYIQRAYKINNSSIVNGMEIKSSDNKSIGILAAGLVF
jgi:hypothetical protein